VSKYLDTRTDEGENPAIRRSGINCAEATDLIPALALGAIDTGERHALRLHCQTCPACAQVLDASERVADFLPFSVPGQTPPDRAKHALFARIADAQAAAAVASPPFTSIAHIDAPVIDSPAGKRRTQPGAAAAVLPTSEPGSVSWPLSVLSSRVGRLAVAPLALAIVLVTLYSMNGIDSSDDISVSLTATAEAADTSTSEVAQTNLSVTQPTFTAADTEQAPSAPDAPTDAVERTSDFADVTFLDTQGASSAGPAIQHYSTNSSGTFVYKAVGSGQTALMGTVAPNFAACSVVQNEPGSYVLTVSGVRLPGGTGIAGVYLVTYEGERIYVTDVVINEDGDGKVTFETERPFEAFRAIEVGMAQQGVGAATANPLYGSVIFSLTTSEVLRGLSPSS
jgi:hypothetical protein